MTPIQRTPVLSDFDVAKEAGAGKIAIVKEFRGGRADHVVSVIFRCR